MLPSGRAPEAYGETLLLTEWADLTVRAAVLEGPGSGEMVRKEENKPAPKPTGRARGRASGPFHEATHPGPAAHAVERRGALLEPHGRDA